MAPASPLEKRIIAFTLEQYHHRVFSSTPALAEQAKPDPV